MFGALVVGATVSPEEALLTALLEPFRGEVTRVVIDVGAYSATQFADAVENDDGLLVMAFEPTPALVTIHRQRVRHRRVVLLPMAVARLSSTAWIMYSIPPRCSA